VTKFVCFHAAFVRVPRENPWTGAFDAEDSAFPSRDWACRAHDAVYGPLAFDPVPDPDGRLRSAANLYRSLSFSFSPLLLAWLERSRPETYLRILEADRESVGRLGHGNALAQPYIGTPLTRLDPGDRRLAVRWGREDFRRRFGRLPEGLWLSHASADEETLELLVAEGFRFTILPAARAGRVRLSGDSEDWQEVRPEVFNPTRPYCWRSRREPGARLALFFPHERLVAAVDSGEALRDGQRLWRAAQARFLPDDSTQLVHAANHGELFGLTHRQGAAMLGQALRNMEADGLSLTNYAAFLDRFPPPQEVELRDAPSVLEPAWRGGLRQALHVLSRQLDAFYDERAGGCLDDPGPARDAYIERLADPAARPTGEFLARHGGGSLASGAVGPALRLLEMQRRRLLMLAESGYDSADLADAEPAQALKNACRAATIAAALGQDFAPRLCERLAAVKSGSGRPPDAARFWSREIAPAAVGPERAAAHFALLEHLGLGAPPRPQPLPGERFALLSCAARRQEMALPAGRDAAWSWLRLVVYDAENLQTHDAAVCVHQLERLDLAAWVLTPQDEPPGLAEAFAAAPAEDFRAELGRRFGQVFFTLDALLGDERVQVLRWLLPDPAGSLARRRFLQEWAAAVGRLRREADGGIRLLELLPRCRDVGVPPDQLPWEGLARAEAAAALERFLAGGSRPDLDLSLRWLAAAERAGLRLDLFELRSRVLLWQERGGAAADAAQRGLLRGLFEKLGLSPLLLAPTEAGVP